MKDYEEDEDIPAPDHAYLDGGSMKKSDDRCRKVFVTYENQRWWLSNWTNTLLPGGMSMSLHFS